MLGAIRTLIVDDSSTLRAMLDDVISDNRDFRPPEHAANASQAIEILEERLFDLVLLDINMPKKGGKEVLADVKQNSDISSIPVIMLTTSKALNDIKDCYALHANSYILKPVSFFEFLDCRECRECECVQSAALPPLLPAGEH